MKQRSIIIPRILLVLLYFIIPKNTEAQVLATTKAIKSLRLAQEKINQEKLEEAKAELENTIKIKSDFAVAYRELGRVNLELAAYEAAIEAYQTSFALDSALSRAAYFECGEAYFRLSKFELAMTYFEHYKAMKDTRYTNAKKEAAMEALHDIQFDIRKDNYAFALKAIETPTANVAPVNLGKKINSSQDDYLPTISSDGSIMIYTTQQSYIPLGTSTGENIFVSKFVNGKWTAGSSFSTAINTKNNEGMAKLSADERFMYFAGCSRSDSKGGCDIYEVQLNDKKLKAIKPLTGNLNSADWDSQPSISCDGTVMYFASNREGGFGGADIWRSFRQADGSWGIPENLGTDINTVGDEESPFIAPDGVTLYFSSNGHPGMGEGDMYMTRLENNNWLEPINLGYPINSPFQDVGLFVKADGETAYFSSSRLGGQGGLDIYETSLPSALQPLGTVHITGQVKDALTDMPQQTTMQIIRNNEKLLLQTDEEGWYFLCLPNQKAYAFSVNQPNYEPYLETAFLQAQDNSSTYRFDILLQPIDGRKPTIDAIPTELHYNLFFGFDEFTLDEKAIEQLNTLVEKLRTETGWEVEIIGYTDDLGDLTYNQMLSEKRANAVGNYLETAGIIIKSIKQEGKGAVKSDDTKKENNRRVEVIIRK
jgi:outer membrane protein OmpA-like peptidoglycan-associated protein/tetratricopeptide (TPR) repeat protein